MQRGTARGEDGKHTNTSSRAKRSCYDLAVTWFYYLCRSCVTGISGGAMLPSMIRLGTSMTWRNAILVDSCHFCGFLLLRTGMVIRVDWNVCVHHLYISYNISPPSSSVKTRWSDELHDCMPGSSASPHRKIIITSDCFHNSTLTLHLHYLCVVSHKSAPIYRPYLGLFVCPTYPWNAESKKTNKS